MQQNCIIVMGMHRSGTSATAGVFSKLGYLITDNVLPNKIDNPKGFFEDAELVLINDEIITSYGLNWHDITLDYENIQEKLLNEYSFDQRIKNLIKMNYSQFEKFIIKDPRLCLLFPLYKRILEELNINVKVIITYRDPIAISHSLQKRDGFSLGKGVTLWFNYFFSAEKNSRKNRRVFINYDRLLENPEQIIELAAKYLDLQDLTQAYENNKKEILEFLDLNLKHIYSHENSKLDYFTLYKEIDKYGSDLNILKSVDFSLVEERYINKRNLFYFQEVRSAINDAERLNEFIRTMTIQRQQIEEKDQIIAEKDQIIAEKDQIIVEKDQIIVEKNNLIENIYATKSWRITKPFRLLNIIKKEIKRFPDEICKRGGLKRVGIKTINSFLYNEWGEIYQQFLRVKLGWGLNDNNKDKRCRLDRRNDYSEWIKQYDTITENDRTEIKDRIERFEYQPLISIVMPVFDPPVNFLEKAIQSVQSQLYENWELCIADDASQDPLIHKLLEKYLKDDKRIKVVFRTKNGHIARASNSALKLVTGEYVALLDHDDLLSEHALFWVVNEINEHRDAKLIYSDEDKIGGNGRRQDAYFKSDWNIDLFLSHNMFCHLGVYKTSLLRKIDGFRVGFEGAQDYDLVLRCLDFVDYDEIRHIPRVLYHWRAIPGSVAMEINEKNYAKLAGKRAINDYLRRNSKIAIAKSVSKGYRVKYKIPKQYPLVSLIIPTRNKVDLLHKCIDSILTKTRYPNYEIIIVNNRSDNHKTLLYLKAIVKNHRIKVITDERSFNYAAINNNAVEYAGGEILGLVNNDIEVIRAGWMREMVSHACRPEVGGVGALLRYPDRSIQHAGIIVGIGGVAGHAHKNIPKGVPGFFNREALLQSFSALTGACLFVRKELFKEVGGLNSSNLGVAFNDVDFCLKLKAKGYRNIWTPYAELYHQESASRGSDETQENRKRYIRESLYLKQRWHDIISHDPAYNPNLTLQWEDFSLAWPPRIPRICSQ